MQAEVIPIGRTRKVLLRLTPQARKALGVEPGNSIRGSIAHEYWKYYYGRRFANQGYKVSFEAPRTGGRVDVLASKNGEHVTIEVETGKSDVVANVRNCLRSAFQSVIVVATDGTALEKVERELAKARLIVPGRVGTVLRDRFRVAG